MTCMIKKYLSKNENDTECTTPKCDMCWYMEKYVDSLQEAKMIRQEIIENCGQDIFE